MSKRKYNAWTEEDMNEATDKYQNKTMGFNEACRSYKIPKPTFRRHVKNLNKHKRLGRPKDLTAAMEAELVLHILELESCFFGLTIKELRRLAFQIAEKYNLHHRFNKEKQLAGWKWYYKFMKNHPEVSLRTPEPTSMARCRGFNKQRVTEFFDKYEKLLDDHKFLPHRILNVDETGLSTVHKPSKILAKKGKHQVGAVTSGERGLNTTCVCCMNAAGEFIPPMLIYKRKRMADVLKRGGPPNTLYTCSDSGWITSELFLEWMKHLIGCTRLEKSDKKQMLLILDGHSTHTKNIEAIKLAREYGIIMLSLPAHTSHRLQPLDKSFFKSLKHHLNKASEGWMRTHPSSVIKQADIAGLLGVAYPRAASMATVLHGFEACGLWPPDRHKIREEDYVPMETSLDEKEGRSILEENDEEIRDTVSSGSVITHAESSENRSLKANTGQVDPFDNPQPSTSSCAIIQSNSPNLEETVQLPVEKLSVQKLPLKETPSACAANKISTPKDSQRIIRSHLQELSPIPRLRTVQKKLSKGTTASQVLTESPYKNDLEKKIDDKNKKKVKLDLNKENIGKVGSSKRNKSVELKTVVRKKKKASGSSDEEWYCIICDENTKESMIQCTACKFWIHDLCAGVNKGTVAYQCDNCSS